MDNAFPIFMIYLLYRLEASTIKGQKDKANIAKQWVKIRQKFTIVNKTDNIRNDKDC